MRRVLYSLFVLALLLLPTSPAYAQNGPGDGRVVIGQDFTLKSGDMLNGDLVVIGGAVEIQQSAKVNGDVVIIGGSLKLDGESTGNAVVIGGVVSLGDHSYVAGDVVPVGGTLQQAEGAKVGGNVVSNFPPPHIALPATPQAQLAPLPPMAPNPELGFGNGFAGKVAGILGQAIGLAVLGMLLTLFVHPQLDRVAQALTRQPFVAGSLGFLSVVLGACAVVILGITIILLPIAITVGILIVLAWLFGIIAFGMEVGDRLTTALHWRLEPVLSTGLGTLMLGLGVGAITLIPCVGWLAPVLIGFAVLGAAVITLFGTRPVHPPLLAVPTGDLPADGAIPPAS